MKTADAIRSKRWRVRHPERAKAATKRWRNANRVEHRQMCRDWVKNNYCPIRQSINRRKSVYGMSHHQFESKRKKQKNKCAICRKRFIGIPCVDHNHKTGANRGLLCRYCNLVLGNARDSVRTLLRAIKYLEKYGASK